MPDIKLRRLPNGLRLITIHRKSEVMALDMNFAVGSCHAKPEQKGLCHFVEHMLFTGTTNRSHEELNGALESLGGSVNAFTGLIRTNFEILALQEEMQRSLELLSDLLLYPSFCEAEVARERQVILNEYQEGLEDLEEHSYLTLYRRAWPKDPLHLDVIGTEETIRSFTREDIRAFYERFFTPENAVLSMVSDRSHEEMDRLVKRYFGAWTGPGEAPLPIPFLQNQRGTFRETYPHSELASVCIVFPLGSVRPEDEEALALLNSRLGASDHSILYREIRIRRGLSYDIYSSLDLDPGVETIEIYCAADPQSIDEILAYILQVLEAIRSGEWVFEEEELAVARKVHRMDTALLLDSAASLARYTGTHVMMGDPPLYYEVEKELLARLTPKDLNRVAKTYLSQPTISIVYPEGWADPKEQTSPSQKGASR
ncbi:hypothetical protein ABB02_01587 [Clostridiaceae bacterium JG1575]|nr:hypothetical protein ABB02_01587 [Clostridiaceae bacterium JG1575]